MRGIDGNGAVEVGHCFFVIARIEIGIPAFEETFEHGGFEANGDRVILDRLIELAQVVIGQAAIPIRERPSGIQ